MRGLAPKKASDILTLGMAEMIGQCQSQAGTTSPETGGPIEQGLVPLCSEQGAVGTQPTGYS